MVKNMNGNDFLFFYPHVNVLGVAPPAIDEARELEAWRDLKSYNSDSVDSSADRAEDASS
jgi:hypothetical protein